MYKTISLVLLPSVFLSGLATADSKPRLNFKVNEFSIAPLEGTSDTAPYQPVMMFLPATEGFAPNVNVQIQPYNGTLAEYMELSKKQFEAGKFTVLREKKMDGVVVWEYSGMFEGRKLHWYAKAELGKGKVFLVTATATESQWKSVGPKLVACVDSFRQKRGEQAAPADTD